MSELSFLSHHHLPKGTFPLQVKHTRLPSVRSVGSHLYLGTGYGCFPVGKAPVAGEPGRVQPQPRRSSPLMGVSGLAIRYQVSLPSRHEGCSVP